MKLKLPESCDDWTNGGWNKKVKRKETPSSKIHSIQNCVISKRFRLFQDIDYETFRKFLDTFLEVQTPEELCKHLFLSFVRRSVMVEGKAFKEMAVLSSTTACAPITSHNKGKSTAGFEWNI